MRVLFLLAIAAVTQTHAFAGWGSRPWRYQQGALQMSTAQDNMSLGATYETLTKQVTEKLGLQQTDFTSSYEADVWSCSQSPDVQISGTSLWLSEASPKYLTGASFCTHTHSSPQQDQATYTINIWMGPSYDVPHMLLTFGQTVAHGPTSSLTTYSLSADYVTRGATPFGSDPQVLDNYYSKEVIQAWSKAYSLPGACPLAPQEEFSSRILNSPVRMALHNIASIHDVNALVHGHVDRFLSWITTAQPIMARARGSFNLRDDKLRQFYFKGEVAKNVASLGDKLGFKVGAANTGPTAEAYVGGGS